jgi:hypothetical protein
MSKSTDAVDNLIKAVEELPQQPVPTIESVFEWWPCLVRNGVDTWQEFEGLVRAQGKVKARVGGAVLEVSARETKDRRPFVIVHMSDVVSRYDVTVFAETLERVRHDLTPGAILIIDVEGKVVNGRVRAHVLDTFDVANFENVEPFDEGAHFDVFYRIANGSDDDRDRLVAQLRQGYNDEAIEEMLRLAAELVRNRERNIKKPDEAKLEEYREALKLIGVQPWPKYKEGLDAYGHGCSHTLGGIVLSLKTCDTRLGGKEVVVRLADLPSHSETVRHDFDAVMSLEGAEAYEDVLKPGVAIVFKALPECISTGERRFEGADFEHSLRPRIGRIWNLDRHVHKKKDEYDGMYAQPILALRKAGVDLNDQSAVVQWFTRGPKDWRMSHKDAEEIARVAALDWKINVNGGGVYFPPFSEIEKAAGTWKPAA